MSSGPIFGIYVSRVYYNYILHNSCCLDERCSVVLVGASLSEPHTSDNIDFRLYVSQSPRRAHAREQVSLDQISLLHNDHTHTARPHRKSCHVYVTSPLFKEKSHVPIRRSYFSSSLRTGDDSMWRVSGTNGALGCVIVFSCQLGFRLFRNRFGNSL